MENIRRNLRNEDEDDLMRMFEEFKKSGSKPSANVRRVGKPVKVSAVATTNSSIPETKIATETPVNKEPKANATSPAQKKDIVDLGLNKISSSKNEVKTKPKKKSLFAMRQASGNKLKDVNPFTPIIPKGNTILSKDVVENENISTSKFSKKKYYDNGFPEVTFDYPEMKNKLEIIEKEDNNKANKCSCGLDNCKCNTNNNYLLASDKIISNVDKEAIHKENMSIIGNMSKNEILEMQKELQNLLKTTKLSSSSSLTPKKNLLNNEKKAMSYEDLDADKKAFIENNQFNTSSLEDVNDMDMLKLAEREATSKEELEKIEWMKPINNDEQENQNNNETLSISRLRFDFKGNIIDKNSDISMSKGLHHHGDDPTHAGYTLDEFLYLTRSTVFSQKSLCIQALSSCIKNAYTGKYSVQISKDIIDYLMEKKSIINIRMALDDANETVIVSALEALATFLGKTKSFDIDSDILNIKNKNVCQPLEKMARCNNFNVFCLNPRNINNYSIKISGSTVKKNLQEVLLDSAPKENENSIEYHADIVSKDIVKGLLKMSLLQRFNYLLKYYPLPPSALDDVIWILSTIALHSEKAANDILNNKNIIYQIIDECLSINWPLTLDIESQTNYPIISALNLIKILCLSSKDNSQYLIDSGILTILIRFILIEPSEIEKDIYPLACTIQEYVLHIFKIIIDYGLYSSVFSDIREAILKYFGSIGTKFISSGLLINGIEEDIWRMNAHFQFLSSLFNCLMCNEFSNEEYLNYAPETLIQPFLKNIIEFLLDLNTRTFEPSYNDTNKFLSIQVLISNGLNMINNYIKYMVKQQFGNINKNNPKEVINKDQLNEILKLSNIEIDKFINNITNDFSISLCSRLKIFRLIWNKNKLKILKSFEIKNEKREQAQLQPNITEFFEFSYLPGWYHPAQIEYINSFNNISMLSYILQKRIESQILLGLNNEAYDDDVMMIIKQYLLILVHPEYTSLSWTSIFIDNLVQSLTSWVIYAELNWEKEMNKLTDLKINEYFQLWYLALLYILPKLIIHNEAKVKYIINCLFAKDNLKFLYKVEFNNIFLNDDKNLNDIILQERRKRFLNTFDNNYQSLVDYSDTIKDYLKKMIYDNENEDNNHGLSSYFIRYKTISKNKKQEKCLPLPINWVFKLIDETLKTYNTPKELITNIKSILFYIFMVLKNINIQQVLLNSPVCLKHNLKDQVISSFGMTNDWIMLELMKIYLISCEGSGNTIEQNETYEIFNDINISRLLIELYRIILKYDRYRNNYMMKSKIVKSLLTRLDRNNIIQSAYCPFNNQSSVSLYKNLIEQFKSSSYGDNVFICYIVYPIQGRYLNEFKELFWNEVQDDFSRLFPSDIALLKSDNVDENIKKEMKEIKDTIDDLIVPQKEHIELFRSTFINWIKPYETSLNILQCMFKCILSVINYELSNKGEANEILETISVVKDILLENKIGNNFSLLNRYISKKNWVFWISVGHISQFIYSKFNKSKASKSIRSSIPYTTITPIFNNTKETFSASIVDDIKKIDQFTTEELKKLYNNINQMDKDFLKCLFLSIKCVNPDDESEEIKNKKLISETLKFNITNGGLFISLLKDVESLNYLKKTQIYDFLYDNL